MIRKLWPALVWAAIILILTGLPGDAFPEVISFWDWLEPDKLMHVFMFGVLSFLVFYGLREQYRSGNSRYFYSILILGVTLAYGLLTEILQANVFVGRDGNIFDFLANSIGVFAGWLAYRILDRKKITA